MSNLKRTTDHGQATGKLYYLQLRVKCTLFCNLQSRTLSKNNQFSLFGFKDESFHLFCRFPHLAKYLEIKYVKLDPIRWKMRGVSSFFISAHFHICLFYVNYKKGCTRLAAASDKVYQLLAHGRWFSPGTSA
jgi:hypothetical protein